MRAAFVRLSRIQGKKLEEQELFTSRLFADEELCEEIKAVLLRLHSRNLASSLLVKAVEQVFPDLRIMLIRAGMLLSYSGLSNEDIKKFFDEVFREYEDRLRVFAFLDYGYASRIEAFVTILYDWLLTVPSLCGTLDGDYPVYNERRDLTPLQRRRLKINDICATQGVRDLLWRTQREVFVLGCSDSHRGDRARYAFGFC